MSCYTRHLVELLPADPTAADKRALDQAIRGVLDMPSADCPDVWEEVKSRRADRYFVTRVEELTARHQSRPQAGRVHSGGATSASARASGGGGVNSRPSPSSGTGER